MNPRVLELIKNPKNIQSEDLHLLKEEIHTFPYIQNIRALHLYGVHLYDKENYQKELSVTAAYTTDKKILYQLINGVIQHSPKPEISEEKQASQASEKEARPNNYQAKGFPLRRERSPENEDERQEEASCQLPSPQEIKHLYVNGERNRILFEGEENFLDEAHSEKIDLESTLESGTLVTQKIKSVAEEPAMEEINEDHEEIEENAGEEFTPEIIINDDTTSSETEVEKVDHDEDLSFHETESLLPEVAVEEEAQDSEEKVTVIENDAVPPSDPEPSAEESDAEVSFHGTDAFLPEVKIQTNTEEVQTADTAETSLPHVNKHEDEMRRLIEEVEKKMKEAKPVVQEEKEEPETISDHGISFAETQSFHFWSTEKEEPVPTEEVKAEVTEAAAETTAPEEEPKAETAEENEVDPEVPSAWKPMSVEAQMPDSLINMQDHVSEPQTEVSIPDEIPAAEPETESAAAATEISGEAKEPMPVAEEITEREENRPAAIQNIEETPAAVEIKEEVPVMNVSFFGTDISSLKVEEKKKENKEDSAKQETVKESPVQSPVQSAIDSNVPGFINTWQSWLKIGRTEEAGKEKVENKEKVIDAFIENSPKISQLKEESSYVVKEKNDDISHLMTETLANLYFEQKLYTKAIKAFEILIKKSPDKKEYFESKIQEIKDFRSKN
ncbi:MAG: hypothetical protein MUW56_09250 [Chryseobacterium sp.]|uniref:hypothetical protein n=1 Tax=Chryseobacterium sp. TaxID=1871047 RepID=UPI0025BADBC2|nr:hypothetical protein [Chryseobacterium sp.]MCJ7933804.1 hypothetical protein [Chryseobacterium sp.]